MFNPLVALDIAATTPLREGEPAPPVDVVRAEFRRKNAEFMASYSPLPKQAGTLWMKTLGVEIGDDYAAQAPWAAILCCADSRAIPEDIFGQPRGRLFVIRTAGNSVDDKTIANLAYALRELKVPLLIVMGHEGCGAVKAAVACKNGGANPPRECALYKEFIDPILGSVVDRPETADPTNASVRRHVEVAADALRASSRLQEAATGGALEVDRVYFHFETGEAEFF